MKLYKDMTDEEKRKSDKRYLQLLAKRKDDAEVEMHYYDKQSKDIRDLMKEYQ